ncbi:MAG: GNAT family N-acetyltransferase [Planctomycetota bacterium]|jgi:ribosomal protein S18 acetylase RimI-like enzyme
MKTKIYLAETDKDFEAIKQLFVEYADFLFELLTPHSSSRAEYHSQKTLDEANNLPGEYAWPKGCILLAEYEGEIAGCIAVSKIAKDLCELKRVYVKPKFRRMGIGKELGDAVIERAVQLKYERIRLITNYDLFIGARPLYRSLGFKEIRKGSPLKNSVHMEVKLV